MSDPAISINFHALPASGGDYPSRHVGTVADAHVPAVGDVVVIRGDHYTVERRTWRYFDRSVDVIVREAP